MSFQNATLFDLGLKATMILAAAFLAAFALRRAPASTRRFVWVIAALCLLMLPVLSIALPPLRIAPATVAARKPLFAAAPSESVIVTASRELTRRAPSQTIPWLLLLWAAGALAVLGHLGAGVLRIGGLTRKASRIGIPDGASQLAATVGAGPVEFLESPRVAMPMTWGILRPRVLLPSVHVEWPAERRRLVLAHELIHVEQRDCLIQLLMQFACALYWFHPLVWLGAAQFRKERERACDDGVIRLGVNGPDYAGHLLELARSLKPGAGSVLAVAMAHQSNLESRLLALLDAKVSRRKLGLRTAIATSLAALTLLVPLASMRAQAQSGMAAVIGTVYDASGAVIPNVTVLLTNTDSHSKETAIANPAGAFQLRSIPAGQYAVEVGVPGFRMYRRNVVLKANENQRLDITMEIGNISEQVQVTAPRPAAQAVAPAKPQRIRVGGNVIAAKLISKVSPVYPEIARQKGIEGTVLLQAVISNSGSVLSLKVLNSADPDLAREATNAVGQWHYEPTLLNGQPVEVVTTITVDFHFQP